MTDMKKRLLASVLLFGSLLSVSAFSHDHNKSAPHKHVHGEAEMEVVMDGRELVIGIFGPLANFLGFEHTPKNETQKQAVIDMTNNLNKGDQLFEFNREAGCSFKLGQVAVRKGKKRDHPVMLQTLGNKGGGEHAEMDATYAFSCANPDALKSVDVKLFAQFPVLEVLDVSMALPKKQMAAKLTPKKPHLSW